MAEHYKEIPFQLDHDSSGIITIDSPSSGESTILNVNNFFNLFNSNPERKFPSNENLDLPRIKIVENGGQDKIIFNTQWKMADLENLQKSNRFLNLQNINPSSLEEYHSMMKKKLCEIIYFDENSIMRFSLAIILMLLGIEHAFLGYKHFRQTMFLSGAMFAITATYFSIIGQQIGTVLMTQQAALAIAGCVSIIAGLLTSMIDYVGLFLTGFYLGCLSCLQAIFVYFFFIKTTGQSTYENDLLQVFQTHINVTYDPNNGQFIDQTDFDQQPLRGFQKDAPLNEISLVLILFSIGSLCAMLTLFKPKPMVIISTAQTGALATMLSADWMIENLKLFTNMFWPTIMSGNRNDNVCQYTLWIWVSGMALVLVGILFQFFVSAKDFSHKYGWYNNDIVHTGSETLKRGATKIIRSISLNRADKHVNKITEYQKSRNFLRIDRLRKSSKKNREDRELEMQNIAVDLPSSCSASPTRISRILMASPFQSPDSRSSSIVKIEEQKESLLEQSIKDFYKFENKM